MVFTFDNGLHNLTSLSIPLVANKNSEGCGCTQFTIVLSPFSKSKLFSVCLSHIKTKPSSDPAAIN